ncbi:DMT family transporter [Paenibacillus sediminis]|uniref:Drug/metabolite transporter (DMT)-like permease n=1 Tax=Paenibacillus sediminis TaxID=664909 RepID=A0ABS4H163_9BACL|nr:DMT family transporter [Paenibacillus sediminis]MBP1936273.1 drug/metabolite transporter (DMT)-like permease [Paenibacillus sediminis]
MKPKSSTSMFIPLFIAIVAVSFSSIFVKWSDAPASIQGMYRLLFTVILMLPFGRKHVNQIPYISKQNWILLILSGFFLALHFLLWMGSLKYTTVASSTMILALEPVFVMIGSFILYKEKTALSSLLGMFIAIGGVAFIAWGDIGVSTTQLYGDILSVLGTAAVAFHMLAGQKVLSQVSSYLYSIIVFTCAVVVFAVYNAVMGISFTNYEASDWGIFTLLAVVPTVFGHLLFNWLMQYISATTVSMSILGEPVGASILAWILLGERLSTLQTIGGVFTLFGLILFMRTKQHIHEPPVTSPSIQQAG